MSARPCPPPSALSPGRQAAAAEVLGAAFFDDPLFRFLCPDDARRWRMLPHFFGTVARLHREVGVARAVEADGELLGVLLGTPPEGRPLPLSPYLRFFVANLLARPSRRPPLPRVIRGIRLLSFVERHHLPEPHWYVDAVGG